MSHRPRVRPRRLASALLALGALGACTSTAAVAAPMIADQRREVPIDSASPKSDVVSSAVYLRVPMLPGAAPHPAACDWIAYQRWRLASGPADSTRADAVTVLMPGILEGATAFDPVARNAIRASARQGRSTEVWALERRANCLEDHTGVDALETQTPETVNPAVALDYYYRGSTLGGKRFAGFDAGDRVLADIGLRQTIEDYGSVILSELPDQAWREKHVVCGGHSLGGPLTEVFAAWDFDGNPSTTADAGYRQCAAFVGFDTFLNAGATGRKPGEGTDRVEDMSGGIADAIGGLSVEAVKAGIAPRKVDLFGISPETMNLLEMLAVGADKLPDGEATEVLRNLPRTKRIEDFLKLAGSKDVFSWITGQGTLRNSRYTYRALMGQVLDDNGAVYGPVRASWGFFGGGPVIPNKLPEQLSFVPGLSLLLAPDSLVLPGDRSELMTWLDYDQVGGAAGRGYTSLQEEVTDADEFTRIVHEGPFNLTENSFPIRLFLEQLLLTQGAKDGGLRNAVHHGAITRKPRVAVIAENGLVDPSSHVDPQVVAPGYEHLDVITAAEQQTGGRPEYSSQTLARLVDAAVPR